MCLSMYLSHTGEGTTTISRLRRARLTERYTRRDYLTIHALSLPCLSSHMYFFYILTPPPGSITQALLFTYHRSGPRNCPRQTLPYIYILFFSPIWLPSLQMDMEKLLSSLKGIKGQLHKPASDYRYVVPTKYPDDWTCKCGYDG